MIEIYKQSLAEEDLIEIWLYTYKKWGEAQANTYLDQLSTGCYLITHKLVKNAILFVKDIGAFKLKTILSITY